MDINSFVSNTKYRFWYFYGWPEYLQSYFAERRIIIMGNEGKRYLGRFGKAD
jgi:hypothetical protein